MKEISSITLSRRDFLKQSGLSAAALPLLQGGESFPDATAQPDYRRAGDAPQVPVLCGMCKERCPLLVRVDKQGRLIDISANPASPLHGGKLCSRALAAANLIDDPDRLRYPLKRSGKRGAGIWQRISWQEALDSVASRLYDGIQQHGSKSVGLFCGRSSSRFIVELCRQLGVVNIAPASDNFCREDSGGYPVAAAGPGSLPAGRQQAPPDIGLFFGCHLGENINIAELREVLALKERGGRIIVCDPRFSVLAAKADIHLMLRPGSDTAIIYGWLRAILDQLLQQARFTTAFQAEALIELRRQLEPYTPALVSQLADIDQNILTETASQLVDPDVRVKIYQGRFAAWHGNDSQRLFGIRLLTLLLDSLHFSPSQLEEQLPLFADLFADGSDSESDGHLEPNVSGNTLLREMLNGEVQTVGVWGSNPFHCYPNPYRTAAAFKKVDFVFCCDLYPTEAALYADIILPEASFLESRGTFTSWHYGHKEIVGAGFPALRPRYECREPGWIVDQLNLKFGSTLFDSRGILLKDKSFLAGRGLAPESFDKAKGIIVLPGDGSSSENPGTGPNPGEEPAGDFSSNMAANEGNSETGQDGGSYEGSYRLPPLTEVPLPPAGFARLFSGRLPVHTGSSTQNNTWLDIEIGENELWINDRIASSMGLEAGDKVHLINQDGIRSITAIRLKTTPGIRADCVYTSHGFGCFSPYLKRSFGRGLADGSLLTRGRADAKTGRPGLRCNFVRIIKNGRVLSFPSLEGQGDAGAVPLLFGGEVRNSKE